jgi:hypothetical protein
MSIEQALSISPPDVADWFAVAAVAALGAALIACNAFIAARRHRYWPLAALHVPTLTALSVAACVHCTALLLVVHAAEWPWAAQRVLLTPWLELFFGAQLYTAVLVDRALIYGFIFHRTLRRLATERNGIAARRWWLSRVDRLRAAVATAVMAPGFGLALWGTFRGGDGSSASWAACVTVWTLLMLGERAVLAYWVQRRPVQRAVVQLRTAFAQGASAAGLALPAAAAALRIAFQWLEPASLQNAALRNAVLYAAVAAHAAAYAAATWRTVRDAARCNEGLAVEQMRRLESMDMYSTHDGTQLAERVNAVLQTVAARGEPLPRAASENSAEHAIECLCMSMFLEWCSRLPPFSHDRAAAAAGHSPRRQSHSAFTGAKTKRKGSNIVSGPPPSVAEARRAVQLQPYHAAVDAAPVVTVEPALLARAVDAMDARISAHHSSHWQRRADAVIARYLTPPPRLADVDAAGAGEWVPILDWRRGEMDASGGGGAGGTTYIEPASEDEYLAALDVRLSTPSVRATSLALFDTLRALLLARLYEHASYQFSVYQLRVCRVWCDVRRQELATMRAFGLLGDTPDAVLELARSAAAREERNDADAGTRDRRASVASRLDLVQRAHDTRRVESENDDDDDVHRDSQPSGAAAAASSSPAMLQSLPSSLHDYRRFFSASLRDPSLLEEATNASAGDTESAVAALLLNGADATAATISESESPVMREMPQY